MRNKIVSFLSLFCLLYSFTLSAQVNELPRSTPEAEGIPSQAVTALFDSLMLLPKTEIHSVMVLRYGKVVAEIYPVPFAPEYSHTMYSCSKTFVSAAVGLAVADNRLRLTDRVATFFPESLPDTISTNLAAMTVRDLLTMTSGIAADWNMRNICTDWIRTFLAKPVREPGKQFEYDSIATYLLSAIVQKVTGMTLLDYLKLKLFNPMNIMEVAWEISPEGYNTGGWGLYIQSESLAKFGQLLLNRGMWKGRQLLPASWVEQMMTKQGVAIGTADDMWKFLAKGDFTVSADVKAQAQADIADDGYWGVEQTSDRILDFAKALSGDDPDKADAMLEAFKKGFEQATKAWGDKLPDISQRTYDAVVEKFNKWKNGTEDASTEA